ncbi:MAG: DedA family protein [Gemmatimonadaceae bacterium]|nr:DedA family protein [Gemmatimonadaceae bacterium]
MGSLDAALTWLAAQPQGALLSLMAALSAVENLFPPIPADVLVAFGAFIAARAGHSSVPAFLAVWLGNMAGVALMYTLGRRFGAARIEARYHLDATGSADRRLQLAYRKYGTFALFLSRFVPGVRAVVPPVAGALRVPAIRAHLAMGAASGIWYGAITLLATRAGTNWELLRTSVASFGSWSAAAAALGFALLGGAIWWRRRRVRRPAA